MYLLEEAISNLKHGGFVNILSTIIVTLTVMIVSVLLLVGNYIHGEVEQLKSEPAVIAFLDDYLDDSSAQQLRSQIEKLEHVDSVTYVSKAEALQRSQIVFGEQAAIITEGFQDINPLPASLEIRVMPDALDAAILAEIKRKVESYEGVEEVSNEQQHSDFIHKIEVVVTGLAVLLGGASIVIVCFSIMLTAYFRREEIRIMKLVGATYWFIRIPLILQGVVLGMTGSMLGLLLFYGIFHLFTVQFGPASFLQVKQILFILLMGIFLGFIAGMMPLRKYIDV